MSTEIKHTTREAWLVAGTELLNKEFFDGNGYELPELRVSVGFPRASSNAIGQCWDSKVSEDDHYEIFICPTQGAAGRVLDILLHELIHAAVGLKEGHRGKFRKLAKEFGLAGRMTATFAEEGSELHSQLQVVAGRLGKFPGAAMSKKKPGPIKSNGWTRFVSVNIDTYKVITNDSQVAEYGAPLDPQGDEMVPVQK